MSLFKKKTVLYVNLKGTDGVLYSGKWTDIPLAEEWILKKSVEFFDDADPCYIHRNAVRVRLVAELEKMKNDKKQLLEIMSAWTGLGEIKECEFSEHA